LENNNAKLNYSQSETEVQRYNTSQNDEETTQKLGPTHFSNIICKTGGKIIIFAPVNQKW